MYKGVSGVSNGIRCIKKYHGSVYQTKGYQQVSNEYQVYQGVSGISAVSNVN